MAKWNLHDSINFLSKVTFRKLWNAALVLSSYYLSRWTGKPVQWGYPISISFEPTTSCNLRCPECTSGLRAFTRPTGMLQKQFFKDTIDQLHKDLLYLVFYFQGEPFLNPDFLDMVAYASAKGIYTATSTNGHFLSDAMARKAVRHGLDRLIISVDGTTQEVYRQYRVGGNLSRVIEGAGNVVRWKKALNSKTPFIIFQLLVLKHNEHQINDVKYLGKQTGVDEVWLKTAQVANYAHDPNHLIPSTPAYSRYRQNGNGAYEHKNKRNNHCWRLWHATVITWDGSVVPCCFDKDAHHAMGSLMNKPFKEIWHNQLYQRFRSQLLLSRKNIDICANCSEGTSVWR